MAITSITSRAATRTEANTGIQPTEGTPLKPNAPLYKVTDGYVANDRLGPTSHGGQEIAAPAAPTVKAGSANLLSQLEAALPPKAATQDLASSEDAHSLSGNGTQAAIRMKKSGAGAEEAAAPLQSLLVGNPERSREYLGSILDLAKQVPPAVVDQLGTEGAAGLRTLLQHPSTDFNDKATATAWATVMKGLDAATSPTGVWSARADLKDLSKTVKTAVISGLTDRAQQRAARGEKYVSPTLEKIKKLNPSRFTGTGLKLQAMLDDPKTTTKEKQGILGLALANAGSPEEQQVISTYYLAGPNRDSPENQARLEVAVHPQALTDIDLPDITSHNPGPRSTGKVARSAAGAPIPTIDPNFYIAGDAKFSPGEIAEINRTIASVRDGDSVAWANIQKFVSTTGPVEIRNEAGGLNEVRFIEGGSTALWNINVQEMSDTLFKFQDGSLGQLGILESGQHELQHLAQFGERGISNNAGLKPFADSLLLRNDLEQEAVDRANALYQAEGSGLRAGTLQWVYRGDYSNEADYQQAKSALAAEKPIVGTIGYGSSGSVLSEVGDWLADLVSPFPEIAGKVRESIVSSTERFADFTSEAFSSIGNTLAEGWAGFQDAFGSIVDAVESWF